MKTVELTKGLHSSVIGFGCASIKGAVSGKTARRAIEFALAHGVNHFDLARSYGYGQAEEFVGQVLKGKRHEVILASKFGIKANWKAWLLKKAIPLLRVKYGKGNRNKSQKIAESNSDQKKTADIFLNRIAPLRAMDIRINLERSLRELKTDYLDYYFVHEPYESLSQFNELAETAKALKKEGKIRAWGIAYMQSQSQLHQSYLKDFDILQFNRPADPIKYNELVANRGAQSNIIFSPMQGGDVHMKPAEKLQQLIADFPRSVILCSMFNEDHIKQNIKIAEQFCR